MSPKATIRTGREDEHFDDDREDQKHVWLMLYDAETDEKLDIMDLPYLLIDRLDLVVLYGGDCPMHIGEYDGPAMASELDDLKQAVAGTVTWTETEDGDLDEFEVEAVDEITQEPL